LQDYLCNPAIRLHLIKLGLIDDSNNIISARDFKLSEIRRQKQQRQRLKENLNHTSNSNKSIKSGGKSDGVQESENTKKFRGKRKRGVSGKISNLKLKNDLVTEALKNMHVEDSVELNFCMRFLMKVFAYLFSNQT
jgi:hypothetical protein